MGFNQPDLRTKLIYNGTTTVDITADYKDSVWVQVYDVDDADDDARYRSFMLEPDEVDLFISVLTLYKNRILSGRKEKGEK